MYEQDSEFYIDPTINQLPRFLDKRKKKQAEEEILEYFCTKITSETECDDIAKAWKIWKERNHI